MASSDLMGDFWGELPVERDERATVGLSGAAPDARTGGSTGLEARAAPVAPAVPGAVQGPNGGSLNRAFFRDPSVAATGCFTRTALMPYS